MGIKKFMDKIISQSDGDVETVDHLHEKANILKTNKQYLSNFTFETEPLVSIIVLNRDGLKYLEVLFDDFEAKTNYSNYEIIFVDNASSDNSVEYIRSLDMDITVIENKENLSFSKANNDAVDIANGEYVLFMNNDIEPTFGWLNEMVGTMIYNDHVGAVGAKLIFPHIQDPEKEKDSFSIQHYGGIFREHVCNDFDYAARHQYKYSRDIFDEKFLNNKKCIIATAAVFLIRKETFLEMGKFDEDYWYGFEDVDLNLKLYKNGYDVVVASAALLIHHESVTRGADNRENYVILNEKWGDYLFDELLRDKFSQDYFMTDKKLTFLLIFKKFPRKIRQFRQLRRAAKYINSQGYSTHILDESSLTIPRSIDVLVSTYINYDIDNIDARDNLIKILIINSKDYDESIALKYDIVLTSDADLNMNNLDLVDMNNLGEELISVINNHYIN